MVGPTVGLVIGLSGPARALLAGELFTINATIGHNLISAHNIQILDVFFAYLQEYLIPPDNFTVRFGNGKIEVFGK